MKPPHSKFDRVIDYICSFAGSGMIAGCIVAYVTHSITLFIYLNFAIFVIGAICWTVKVTTWTSLDKFFSCGKKIKYSETSANRAVTQMEKKGRGKFEAYKCRYCPAWHIGHANPKRQGSISIERPND